MIQVGVLGSRRASQLSDKSDKDEIVITPGGPRSRGMVSAVSPGNAVRFSQQGGFSMVAVDMPDLAAPEDFVLAPGGYRHKSLVHSIGSGIALDFQDGAVNMEDIKANSIMDQLAAKPAAPGTVPALGIGWSTSFYRHN